MMEVQNKEEILSCLEELQPIHYPRGLIYRAIHDCKAFINIQDNELEAIYNLAQVHTPDLRNKTVLRYEKLLADETKPSTKVTPMMLSRENLAYKCSFIPTKQKVQEMLSQLEEMPKEWTIVQLTPQYSQAEYLNENNNIYYTNSLYISVLHCGKNQIKPFVVTVNPPKDPVQGKTIEIIQEMMSTIQKQKDILSGHKNKKKFKSEKEKTIYMDSRQEIEDRIRGVINDTQSLWLKEWRCLFTGKYCDDNLESQVQEGILEFFKTEVTKTEVTEKIQAILACLVKNSLTLKLTELKSAIQYCFALDDKNTIKNIAAFVRNLGDRLLSKNANTKRQPIILVIDSTLECIPWENIDVLQDHPVSRLPSLHFVYCLFKEHEKDIVDGHKIVTDYDKGSYIVNPDKDLKLMEVRMMSFYHYWTPEWTGTSGYPPDKDEYFELLTSSDIFIYNGHGGGSHLMSLDKVQKSHVKAIILLFGCGSTRIYRMDPQVEMCGNCHVYLIARCACVVGMLWEVTDTDTDTLTTDFLSCWIPSNAPYHWRYVDSQSWKAGKDTELRFVRFAKPMEESSQCWEPELLRAICLSRKRVKSHTVKFACVARGLPVKIKQKLENVD